MEKEERQAELILKLDYLREVIHDLENQVASCDKTLSEMLLGDRERLHDLITEVGEFVGVSESGGNLVGKNSAELTGFMRGMSDNSLALSAMLMQAKLREVGVWLASKEYNKTEKELDSLD